jgi:DNA-binding NtrC family response regulator
MLARLLIVDDDGDSAHLLAQALVRRGHTCEVATSSAEAADLIAANEYDLVLTDVQLDGISGLELCAQVRERWPETPTIVITGFGTLDLATEALRAGAYDLVLKPVELAVLSISVTRALEVRALRLELGRLQRREASSIAGIVGDSPEMQTLLKLVAEVADNDAAVLICGESGTGKELVARALHDQSRRHDQPFVAVNCAALPAALLESELFGHARGAFTDASRARPGLIREAGRGTLFLDEIAELPAEMQAKLLRAFQERKVRAVGGDQEVSFDARLITATNRDLDLEVKEKRFREDLYYRINVIRIEIPSLRARPSDILVIAQHLIRRLAVRTGRNVDRLTASAAERLLAYGWPGNVRELENCMERAIAVSRTSALTVGCLPKAVRDHEPAPPAPGTPDAMMTLIDMRAHYVRRVLTACHGNKTAAARILGIDRRSVYRQIEEPEATTLTG